jgi:multiple sugar transport system permease protein
MVDGTSQLGAFFRVILPLSAPGLVATAMFCFILSWNEYLYALILVTSESIRTLPVGIQGTYRTNDMDPQLWAALMSASVISTLPVVLLFLLLQRYLVAGLTAGAVKA